MTSVTAATATRTGQQMRNGYANRLTGFASRVARRLNHRLKPMSKSKRIYECLFCTRRSCYERVVSTDDGNTYDEIACIDHVRDLHKHSDALAPKIMKRFISSTRKQKRGDKFNRSIK